MTVNPIMQAGLSGVQMGIKGMNRAAQDIADLNLDDRSSRANDNGALRTDKSSDQLYDAAEAVVDLKVHARHVQASARVIQTADEVLGFLLDVRA
jgi:hypothetical protein